MQFKAAFFSLTTMLTLVACGNISPTETNTPKSPNPTDQIVGGIVSPKGSRPYMAYIGGCGGSVIGKQWILTAAHCVTRNKPAQMKIRVGMYNRRNKNEGETIGVSQIHVHPQYGNALRGYDIALLKLAQPISHQDAAPVSVPGNAVEAILDVKGKRAVVSGWGMTKGGGRPSQELREVSVPITPNPQQCSGRSAPANTICGEPDQGKDSCNGDSGGPLASQHSNGKWYVLGIVSYGPPECKGSGTYTRVNAYIDWIKKTSGIDADNGDGTGNPDNEKYEGTVNTNSSSFQPNGTKGFNWNGGMLKATLSSNASGDFDFYLQKKEGLRWIDVGNSTNEGHNEAIEYNGAAGLYRWEVYAYEGQGNYTIEIKP